MIENELKNVIMFLNYVLIWGVVKNYVFDDLFLVILFKVFFKLVVYLFSCFILVFVVLGVSEKLFMFFFVWKGYLFV